MRLEEIRVHAGETSAFLASSPQVEIHQAATGLQLSGDSVSLQRDQLSGMWQMLHERLLRQPKLWAPAVCVKSQRVLIEDARGTVALHGLHANLTRDEHATRARVRFRHEEQSSEETELLVERQREMHASMTRVELNAEQTGIPLVVLHGSGLADELLGRGVIFQGKASCQAHATHLDGDVVGRLRQVRLESLGRILLGEPVHGEAELSIVQASWRAGQFHSLDLVVVSQGGRLSGQALATAAQRFNLKIEAAVRDQPGWLEAQHEFDRLAFRIRLNPEMILLQAVAADTKAILTSRGTPYLSTVSRQLGEQVSPLAMCYRLEQIFRSRPGRID
jgi:hypothetical protein